MAKKIIFTMQVDCENTDSEIALEKVLNRVINTVRDVPSSPYITVDGAAYQVGLLTWTEAVTKRD